MRVLGIQGAVTVTDATRFYQEYWTAGEEAPPERDPLTERRWKLPASRVRPGFRVLDYGCGGGVFAKRLFEAGCEVVGIDVAEEALNLARQRVPGVQFLRVCPGQPLPGGGFDVIWASEVLEHVYDTEFLMREFARVLKPEGELLLTVPYHGVLKNLAIVLFRFERHFNPRGGHVRFFTRRSLCKLAEEAGFVAREFVGLGRCRYLWKSMFLRFQKH